MLYKSPAVTEKNLDREKLWKKIYEVIGDGYVKQSEVEFPKYFILKFITESNVSRLIPVEFKKTIQ